MMEGIGVLVLKITRYVLREEKREPFSVMRRWN